MSNSSRSQTQTDPKPVSVPKIVICVFSLGVVFGTGLGHGYHRVINNAWTSSAVNGKYNLLYLGMSPTDARAVLGPGVEISQSVSRVALRWPVSGEHAITAVFENGELIEKTQQDL